MGMVDASQFANFFNQGGGGSGLAGQGSRERDPDR